MSDSMHRLSAADREYMLAIAVEHYTEGRLPQCEKLLRGLLAAEPENTRGWELLGSCLAVQGYRSAAQQVYLRVLELAPNSPYALVALAEIALDAVRWNDAKLYLARLFELDPDGIHPAGNRGRKILQEGIQRFQKTKERSYP